MRVINADGSEAEMCGNGVRCVARYIDEKTPADAVRIETLAGIIEAGIVTRGETYQVRVRMGVPEHQGTGGFGGDAAVVSVGNPHLVLFLKPAQEIDLEREGESLQRHSAFPAGVNLHAVRVLDERTLDVRHYERGAGLTMACGTGAVASAAAAIVRNAAKSPVTVRVPGGELIVEWDGKNDAYLTGPAVHVFNTEVAVRIPEPH
jgi:diaminopimelate epimerase